MGPPIAELFRSEAAEVIASEDDLTAPDAPARVVREAGHIDVLVANLAHPPEPAPVGAIRDEDWHTLFDRMVHPLMRLVRAAVPPMIERRQGKVVAVTSAAPLRGIPKTAAYCAARGAQNAFIRAAGLEVARHDVQVNAIAQNYVRNDTYYPDDLVASERFRQHLERNVPARRIAEPWETAQLALFLASDESRFMVGQILPFAGGWTTTM